MLLRIFVISTFLLWQFSLNGQAISRALVLDAAELSICGKTNVNSFNCSLRKINLSDTLKTRSRAEAISNIFNGVEIRFNVADFGCDLDLMTRDFRKLLKYDTHPQIVMRIDEIRYESGSSAESGGPVSAVVTLMIAGEKEIEHIRKASIHKIQKKLIFSGTHEVLMTRFKIDPPTRFFGAVRAEDLLEIAFAIQIR